MAALALQVMTDAQLSFMKQLIYMSYTIYMDERRRKQVTAAVDTVDGPREAIFAHRFI
jgi:hypothetical protein